MAQNQETSSMWTTARNGILRWYFPFFRGVGVGGLIGGRGGKNLGLGVLEEVRDGDSDSEGVEEAGKQDPIAKALNPQGPKPDIQLVDEEPHGTKRRATEDPESSSDEDDEDHEDDENDEDDGEEASEIKTIVAESTRHGKGPKEEAVAA